MSTALAATVVGSQRQRVETVESSMLLVGATGGAVGTTIHSYGALKWVRRGPWRSIAAGVAGGPSIGTGFCVPLYNTICNASEGLRLIYNNGEGIHQARIDLSRSVEHHRFSLRIAMSRTRPHHAQQPHM